MILILKYNVTHNYQLAKKVNINSQLKEFNNKESVTEFLRSLFDCAVSAVEIYRV